MTSGPMPSPARRRSLCEGMNFALSITAANCYRMMRERESRSRETKSRQALVWLFRSPHHFAGIFSRGLPNRDTSKRFYYATVAFLHCARAARRTERECRRRDAFTRGAAGGERAPLDSFGRHDETTRGDAGQ